MQTGAIDTYKRLLGYLEKRLGTFIVGITSMVVIAATEVGLPAILQPILDGTFVNKDPFFLKWGKHGVGSPIVFGHLILFKNDLILEGSE